MTIWESILIAIAVCFDSLAVSTACALQSKMKYRQGLLMAITFAIFQGAFPLFGALLGNIAESFIKAIDHWIAFSLLSLVGGKMLYDAFCPVEKKTNIDTSKVYIILTLAIATSIDAFVVGIGYGLNSTIPQIIFTTIIIAIATFLSSMLGIFIGNRNIPLNEKATSILGGLVLIGLGVKILIQHLITHI